MLREQTIRIVKSTVPVLEQYGNEITKRFYQLLLTGHPELLNLFNHANQKQGRQQTALANAVYAAAQHIDHLEAILPAVRHIAQKHRSLGVKAEHYPIVGETLLAAIKEVLGNAATEDILGAWAEAYGVIADAFIGMEAGLYKQAERQEGGWVGFRAFRVERKVQESDVITSFYLVPEDGQAMASFEPGQYISVKVDIPGEDNTHVRQYSLSDAPGRPYYRISVKREDGKQEKPAGKVSVYLHERVGEGAVLWVSAPAGGFTLDRSDDRPVVLISGGVGLTPLLSMLQTLVETNPSREVIFIHAARNGRAHAFRKQVEEAALRYPQAAAYWCYSSPADEDKALGAYHKEGRIDLAWLRQAVPNREASFYYCGPVPFMKTVNRLLQEWGIPEADRHYEFFGPFGILDSVPKAAPSPATAPTKL